MDYRKELHKFNSPIWDFIDMVYIMTLESSKERHKNIFTQINNYNIASNISIIYNKGYRNSNKVLPGIDNNPPIKVEKSYQDLTHMVQYVYKDALKNNYDTILILEDDFIINEEIINEEVKQNIKNIIKFKKNSELLLKLGCIPFLSFKYNNNFKNVVWSAGNHAIIYNKNAIKKATKIIKYDYDENMNSVFFCDQLMYSSPLVYATWPETENYTHAPLKNISDYWLKLLLLDKYPNPGFFYLYNNWSIRGPVWFLLDKLKILDSYKENGTYKDLLEIGTKYNTESDISYISFILTKLLHNKAMDLSKNYQLKN